MEPLKVEQFKDALPLLEHYRDLARARGYFDSVRLVEVLMLDFKMKVYGISDSEIKAFCVALDITQHTLLFTEREQVVRTKTGPRRPRRLTRMSVWQDF